MQGNDNAFFNSYGLDLMAAQFGNPMLSVPQSSTPCSNNAFNTSGSAAADQPLPPSGAAFLQIPGFMPNIGMVSHNKQSYQDHCLYAYDENFLLL
jgi:hypothetical protein